MVIPLIWQSSYPTKIFPLTNIFNKRILFKSYPEKHQNWNELQLLDCCQDVNVGRGFHLLIPLSRHIAVGAMWREVGWVGWEWGRWVNVWWGRGITTTITTFPQPSFLSTLQIAWVEYLEPQPCTRVFLNDQQFSDRAHNEIFVVHLWGSTWWFEALKSDVLEI